MLVSTNPATLEPLGSVARTDPDAVAAVVDEARAAQERWGRVSAAARARLMRSVVSVLLARAEEIAALVTAENGKPLPEAYTGEVLVAVDSAAWLAARAGRVLAPERVRFHQPHLLHKRASILHEPIGVVAVVAPWNFPFAIPFVQAAFAVAAGNAVVVKPSELTPLTGAWVERVFAEAGAPPALVRVVQGEGATVGEALVRAPGVGKVVFTGSTEVGRRIATLAGELPRPVTLELGGKDPMLVLADADLGRAAAGAAFGAFVNCGQACTAVERVYVAAELLDPFVDALVGRVRALRVGRGDEPGVELGPLISERQRAGVESALAQAVGRRRRGRGRRRAARARSSRLVSRAHRSCPGGRHAAARAGRGVRPGRDGDAGRLGRRGGPPCERHALRPRRERLDARPRPRAPHRVAHRRRHGVDERRRLLVRRRPGVLGRTQGLRLRRHPVASRPARAHADQVRRRRPRPRARAVVAAVRAPAPPTGFRGLLGVVYGRGLVPRARAGWRHRRGLLALARRYRSRP